MVVNAGDQLAEKANHAEVNHNQLIADHDENEDGMVCDPFIVGEVSVQAHTPLSLYNEKRNLIGNRWFLPN